MTTYTPVTKSSTTFTDVFDFGKTTYLLTDTPDYILVGSSEDETLVLWETTSFAAGTKNTTTYTPVSKN